MTFEIDGAARGVDSAATRVHRHRQAFDAWLKSAAALDDIPVLALEAAERKHEKINVESDRALSHLVDYHPTTLNEVGEIAAHLSVHFRRDHFDKSFVANWMDSLALCSEPLGAPAILSGAELDAVNRLDAAHSDSMALVQTLREALQGCMASPEANFPNPFSSERLFLTLGVLVDLLKAAEQAADVLSGSRQKRAAP